MTNKLAFRILLALIVLGAAAVAIVLRVALSALSTGPNIPGYDLLNVGMQALPYLSAVVVVTVVVGSIGGRVRFAVGGLALTSGVVGGIGAGLAALGLTLAQTDPLHQPVALNSLLLAVHGVGTQVAPAAVVLAAGAASLAVGTTISRHLKTRGAAIPAAAV